MVRLEHFDTKSPYTVPKVSVHISKSVFSSRINHTSPLSLTSPCTPLILFPTPGLQSSRLLTDTRLLNPSARAHKTHCERLSLWLVDSSDWWTRHKTTFPVIGMKPRKTSHKITIMLFQRICFPVITQRLNNSQFMWCICTHIIHAYNEIYCLFISDSRNFMRDVL